MSRDRRPGLRLQPRLGPRSGEPWDLDEPQEEEHDPNELRVVEGDGDRNEVQGTCRRDHRRPECDVEEVVPALPDRSVQRRHDEQQRPRDGDERGEDFDHRRGKPRDDSVDHDARRHGRGQAENDQSGAHHPHVAEPDGPPSARQRQLRGTQREDADQNRDQDEVGLDQRLGPDSHVERHFLGQGHEHEKEPYTPVEVTGLALPVEAEEHHHGKKEGGRAQNPERGGDSGRVRHHLCLPPRAMRAPHITRRRLSRTDSRRVPSHDRSTCPRATSSEKVIRGAGSSDPRSCSRLRVLNEAGEAAGPARPHPEDRYGPRGRRRPRPGGR